MGRRARPMPQDSSEILRSLKWEFPKFGGTLFGVLIIRILLFRVLDLGPLFSGTPKIQNVSAVGQARHLASSPPTRPTRSSANEGDGLIGYCPYSVTVESYS